MTDEQRELKCLKKLVKAQERMITGYRTGKANMPEWVFKAISDAKNMFQVSKISEIK